MEWDKLMTSQISSQTSQTCTIGCICICISLCFQYVKLLRSQNLKPESWNGTSWWDLWSFHKLVQSVVSASSSDNRQYLRLLTVRWPKQKKTRRKMTVIDFRTHLGHRPSNMGRTHSSWGKCVEKQRPRSLHKKVPEITKPNSYFHKTDNT